MAAEIPLLVFAKEPIAGSVKTRLLTHCSTQQAAEIAVLLLAATLQTVTKYWPGSVSLCVWPNAEGPQIRDLAARFSVPAINQDDGDLGDKMHSAMQSHGYPACVVGADTPQISEVTLQRAYQNLSKGNNVIGPSPDGGYYLIGLARPRSEVFADIAWSTETVLKETLTRAEFELLESANDIDTWADLQSARSALPTLNTYLLAQGLA